MLKVLVRRETQVKATMRSHRPPVRTAGVLVGGGGPGGVPTAGGNGVPPGSSANDRVHSSRVTQQSLLWVHAREK